MKESTSQDWKGGVWNEEEEKEEKGEDLPITSARASFLRSVRKVGGTAADAGGAAKATKKSGGLLSSFRKSASGGASRSRGSSRSLFKSAGSTRSLPTNVTKARPNLPSMNVKQVKDVVGSKASKLKKAVKQSAEISAKKGKKAWKACKGNPMVCSGALLAGGLLANHLVKEGIIASEAQKECMLNCRPENWAEYSANTCLGNYWEGRNTAPENGEDVSHPAVVANIRNHCYMRDTVPETFLDFVEDVLGVEDKSMILCDLDDTQLPQEFGGFAFDTSYVLVDGVYFVPSVRFAVQTAEAIADPLISNFIPRDDLVLNGDTYRTDIGDPTISCLANCVAATPLGFIDSFAAPLFEMLTDGPLSAIGDILKGFVDPAMLGKAGVILGALVLYMAYSQLPGGKGTRAVIIGVGTFYLHSQYISKGKFPFFPEEEEDEEGEVTLFELFPEMKD